MTWLYALAGAWLAVAIGTALLIGRAVHTADVIEHTDGTPEAAPERSPRPDRDDEPPAAGPPVAIPRAREALAEH